MKTEFELEANVTYVAGGKGTATAKIIGREPEHKPYVVITVRNTKNTIADVFIPDKQIERFAVNILKALKSKKLK